MDHDLVLENSSSATVYILPNTIYLKAIKYLNVRFNINIKLKVRVQKIDDRMLYYGWKVLRLLCWN